MNEEKFPATGGWLTEDFKWLVLDMYVDLAERIIMEGLMDGSKKAQDIAKDMVILRELIDGDDVLRIMVVGSFGSMQNPGADLEKCISELLEDIEKYRKEDRGIRIYTKGYYKSHPHIKEWSTQDFQWLVLDAYTDLTYRILRENLMDGSKTAQDIANNMMSLGAELDKHRLLEEIKFAFGSMEVPDADIKAEISYILEELEEYREKRKKATE